MIKNAKLHLTGASVNQAARLGVVVSYYKELF